MTGDTSLSCAGTVLEGEDRHSTVESVLEGEDRDSAAQSVESDQGLDQQQLTDGLSESEEDAGKDLVGYNGANMLNVLII